MGGLGGHRSQYIIGRIIGPILYYGVRIRVAYKLAEGLGGLTNY